MTATTKTTVRMLVCAMGALALTAVQSWSVIDSTSVARWVTSDAVQGWKGALAERTGSDLVRGSVAALVE